MAQAYGDGIYEERSALYYPYIRIRSENWLKSTLLAFQKVSRIVPDAYLLADEAGIQPYSALAGPDGTPLLDRANSQTHRVRREQDSLFAKLREHEATLATKFAYKRTPKEFRSGKMAFQVHRMKILNYNFSEWLEQAGLAWNSREPGEYDTGSWLTMHPRLGSAIMSVLALVVAKQDGLKVVTPSQQAHETLLANTGQHVIAKLLDLPELDDEDAGGTVTVQELCQLVLVTGFDLTRLKPQDICDMIWKGGRDLTKFYGKLSRFAGNIPEGLDDSMRTKRLKAKADEVLADWRNCTEKLPQLREAIKKGVNEIGLEKAVDIAKEAVGAKSVIHFLGGLPGVALAIGVKAGSFMLRNQDTPYSFLNRVDKAVDKSIGTLYVPQWRELAS